MTLKFPGITLSGSGVEIGACFCLSEGVISLRVSLTAIRASEVRLIVVEPKQR